MEEFLRLLYGVKQLAARSKFKYVEFRPLSLLPGQEAGLEQSDSFYFHKVDLGLTNAELFGRFHKDCVQRKIQRAQREGLVYEDGYSEALLGKFYELQKMTRRRQELPPQPLAWFRNLADCMGEKLKIHVVSKNGKSIASILTLRSRGSLVYKYGGSDKQFSNLGGTQLLFWTAIEDAKRDGLVEFDLGRSDPTNEGLVQFKNRLGAVKSTVTYWRYSPFPMSTGANDWKMAIAKRVFSRLPDAWLTTAGNLLYRHIG
jgi:lipid II:glycine glycyltransferase (peptidoglycan interpeptide bridge formation enzyme)